jgi:mRNA-degrading endonuclease RelE of RelBE toxin-antitoxin system
MINYLNQYWIETLIFYLAMGMLSMIFLFFFHRKNTLAMRRKKTLNSNFEEYGDQSELILGYFLLFTLWPIFGPLLLLLIKIDEPIPDAQLIEKFERLASDYQSTWKICNRAVGILNELDLRNFQNEIEFLNQYKILLREAQSLEATNSKVFEDIFELANKGDGSLIDLDEIYNFGRKDGKEQDWCVLSGTEYNADGSEVSDNFFEPEVYYLPADVNQYVRKEKSEWKIHISPTFKKAIKKLNSASKDKFLDAIGEILRDPLSKKGDLIKPLNNNKKGLWRYRLGKKRILYHPDVIDKKIILLDFSDRSKIYR